MARNRNKKLNKLRNYRDKLLVKITNLEGTIRMNSLTFMNIRKCLQGDDLFRAYAMASEPVTHDSLLEEYNKNEVIKELTLVYRVLAVERQYTEQISKSADARDYLRVAALTAEHSAEIKAHDKMLEQWWNDTIRQLRKRMEDEEVA